MNLYSVLWVELLFTPINNEVAVCVSGLFYLELLFAIVIKSLKYSLTNQAVLHFELLMNMSI